MLISWPFHINLGAMNIKSTIVVDTTTFKEHESKVIPERGRLKEGLRLRKYIAHINCKTGDLEIRPVSKKKRSAIQ
jgi:hypothetical protein